MKGEGVIPRRPRRAAGDTESLPIGGEEHGELLAVLTEARDVVLGLVDTVDLLAGGVEEDEEPTVVG